MDAKTVYERIKATRTPTYDEEKHCLLILEVMLNPEKGRISSFCQEAFVCENTFFNWVNRYELFRACYLYGKMAAREIWEKEGYKLRDLFVPLGQVDHTFEHWKMVGWSRFGVSKNSRIKLSLDPNGKPNEHYTQLLHQAKDGDFTASEFKQLMEAINVGIRAHEIIELQNQIDQLKSDLITMGKNSGQNTHTNQRIEKKD